MINVDPNLRKCLAEVDTMLAVHVAAWMKKRGKVSDCMQLHQAARALHLRCDQRALGAWFRHNEMCPCTSMDEQTWQGG